MMKSNLVDEILDWGLKMWDKREREEIFILFSSLIWLKIVRYLKEKSFSLT